MSELASLWALFASSFLAATLLPGGSEAALYAVLRLYPDHLWTALTTATIGNTLGGMTSYLLGRLVPTTKRLAGLQTMQRWGTPALLLSWVPFIGDPLCAAAGWMRLNAWLSALFMAIGKFARYVVIAAAAG